MGMEPRGESSVTQTMGDEVHTENGSAIYSAEHVVSEVRRNFTGWDIEEYHKRKRAGELLPYTPWKQFNASGSWEGSYYSDRINGNVYETAENWSDPVVASWRVTEDDCSAYVDSQDMASMVQAASAKLYSQGFDALTATAELSKLIAQFVGLRARLLALITKGNVLKSWLEYRYAWRTLYYDLLDLSKALNEYDIGRTRWKERVGYTFTETWEDVDVYSGGVDTYTTVTGHSVVVSVRGSIVADLVPPVYQFNAVTTAWELVTFSFMIDWFLNVGQFLNGLSFLTIAGNYAGAGGVKVTYDRVKRVTEHTPNPTVVSEGTLDARSDYTAELITRVPLKVPLTPFWQVNLDVPKVIDLWAIVKNGIDGSLLRR